MKHAQAVIMVTDQALVGIMWGKDLAFGTKGIKHRYWPTSLPSTSYSYKPPHTWTD